MKKTNKNNNKYKKRKILNNNISIKIKNKKYNKDNIINIKSNIKNKNSKKENNYEEINYKEIEKLEENNNKHKIYLIISIFLIILMLSWVFVMYPIGDIIGGKTETNTIKNNRINYKNISIIFSNNVYNEIKTKYLNEQNHEISLCLLGEIYKNNNKSLYVINKIYEPKIYYQSYNKVEFEQCSNNTLIMLHSHPYKHCIGSKQDFITLNLSKKINKNRIMMIMCDIDEFTVYP